MTNKELKTQALEALSGNWGTAVGLFLVVQLILSAASFVAMIPVVGYVAIIFISGAFEAGLIIFALNLLEGEGVFEDGFKGFSQIIRFGGASFMVALFTMLWSLLFIIPGIIKGFSYSMTLYIMAEDESIGVMEAITKSRELMDGNKLDLFVLFLSFIGWTILCFFTFGIGFLWLVPYMEITIAAFYNDIKPDVVMIEEMPEIVTEA